MARRLVKVYLTQQQKQLLEIICQKLGMDESETMRLAFLEYAKSINLITQTVHGK